MWLNYFEQYLAEKFPRFLSDRPWNYKNDICVAGAHYLAQATGSKAWYKPVLDGAHRLMDEEGRVANFPLNENNADKVSFGKSLRILHELTGDERYANGVRQAYHMLDNYPRTVTGNFWHKDIYPNQVWLDGFYMIMPFYAACLIETGEDKWDDVFDQFSSADKLLWDEKLGLYRHGCDCSRKAPWCDPETGRSASAWLRAAGWWHMALVDVYEMTRERTPRAAELIPLLKKSADGILNYQVPETKMLLQVIDRADLEGNYSETSGSAMVAYALMKGARLGMLSAEYGDRGSEMLDGIRDTCLKNVDGDWQLHNICASAGLGRGPDPHNKGDRNGTAEYYLSEAQMVDNQHGTAACMMAVSEQLRR